MNEDQHEESNQKKEDKEPFFDKFEKNFKIDFFLFFPLALFLLHIRWWTFCIVALV